MRIEDKYEFDLKGYIIYENALNNNDVQLFLDVLQQVKGAEGTGKFAFFDLHPCFIELMAREDVIDVAKALCGDWVRFDHALGLRMSNQLQQGQALHGGNGGNQGAFAYKCSKGQISNGLIKILFSLVDVNEGDGGFVCIPGSHKSDIDYFPKSFNDPLVIHPTMKAGDALVFTEALVHGSRPWKADKERFALVYSYAPGFLAWKDVRTLEHYKKFVTNKTQSDLLRPPFVGSYEEPAPNYGQRWPSDRRSIITEGN